jgi:hypothetical protein
MLLAIAVQPKVHWDFASLEMQDLPPVVADDEKAVQNSKRERWDGEEIHCSNGLAMVSEERQPALHSIGISRSRDGERLRGKIAFPELPNGIDDRRVANPTPCGISLE